MGTLSPIAHRWQLCPCLTQRPGRHPQFLPSVTPHPHHQQVSWLCFRVVSSIHHPLPGPAPSSGLDCGRSLLCGLPTSTSALHCLLSTGSREDPVGSPMSSHHCPVVPGLLRTKPQLLGTAWPPSLLPSLPSSRRLTPLPPHQPPRCASPGTVGHAAGSGPLHRPFLSLSSAHGALCGSLPRPPQGAPPSATAALPCPLHPTLSYVLLCPLPPPPYILCLRVRTCASLLLRPQTRCLTQ